MSPLIYLLSRKAKNNLKEFLHKPSRIIPAALIIAVIIFTVYTGAVSQPPAEFLRDKNEFYAIVLVLYTFVFIMSARNGFINGAAMFSMADVNLTFTAPVKENKVLTYGLIQQLGKSLAPGLFILYQSGTVNNIYGIKITAIIPLLIGYAATLFFGQITSAMIYSLTCSDDKKCRQGKIIFYGIFVVFALIILIKAFENGITLSSVISAAREKFTVFLPVSGLIAYGVESTIEGNFSHTAIVFVILVLLCLAYYSVTSKIKKDYYEDVIKSAEISFSAITARKEGKAPEAAPRNVKVGKTGFTKGSGASAINEKHKKENKRSNRFFISTTGILMIAFSVLYSFMFSGEALALLVLNAYTVSMSVCAGRWAKEFSYPYIYLIPESSFKKLIHLIREDLPSLAVESILCFLPLIFFGNISIIEVLSMAAARFTFGFMFIGVNLLLQRIFGDSEKKMFSVIVYMIFVVLFSVPALAAGIFTGGFFPFNFEIAYTVMAIINTLTAFLLIFLCRNVLEFSENNNR